MEDDVNPTNACFVLNLKSNHLVTTSYLRLWIPEKMRQTAKADMTDASINSEDDDNSVFTPVELLSSRLPLPELSGGWRPKYQIPLRSLSLKNQSGSSVFLYIEQDGLKQKRELIFGSSQEAADFVTAFKREKVREPKRLDSKLNASLGGIQLKRGERLDILIEIVRYVPQFRIIPNQWCV